ncbi:MAG: DNA polymerase I [Patescibacteria group bacterium]|nr:DNA polymerase I [Patescibacteria group bacterium]
MKKKIIIIDANALIHRSFHALPDTLRTKDGILTNAVYGFMLVFLRVIDEFNPDYLVATFDSKGKTFRHKMFKDYKAKRVKPPNELYQQIPLVKKVLKAFGVPIYAVKGLEADDLIGAIASKINHKAKLDSVIVTGDADIFQLVNHGTKVFILRRGTKDIVLYDIEAVKKRYGLGPEQIVNLKALAGDPSDNIPGAVGIGEKTATTLLQKYKNITNIYKHLEEIGGSLATKLKQSKKDVYLSHKLATIKTKFPLNFNLEETKFGKFDKQKVQAVLKELEFFTLLERLKLADNSKEKTEGKLPIKVADISKVEELSKQLRQLNKKSQEIFFTIYEKPTPKICEKTVFECHLKYLALMSANGTKVLMIKAKGNELVKTLMDYLNQRVVISFGGKQEFELLKIRQPNAKKELVINEDVKIMAYLLEAGRGKADFISLAKKEGFDIKNLQKLQDSAKGQTKLLLEGSKDKQQEKDIKNYLVERLRVTRNLYLKNKREMVKVVLQQNQQGISPVPAKSEETGLVKDKPSDKQNLNFVYRSIEIPLVKVLAKMELRGIKLDSSKLKKIADGYQKEAEKIKKAVFRLAGQEFNLKSSQQLSKVFYEDLKFSTAGIKKGKSGYYSTSAKALAELASKHKVARLVGEYRELVKLISTYLLPLPDLVNKKTQRLHTQFNQEITTTGRLSSSSPNLQNIPTRTLAGQKIREAFIVPSGFSLVSIDYSQIELRIAAHYSQDETMLKVFQEGGDIHTETARQIHGIKSDKITAKIRNTAKALNFGLIYGMGTYGFARSAGIDLLEAKEFVRAYKEKFPRMFEYLAEAKKTAQKKNYAETMFGRRRYVPEIKSSNWQLRSSGERMAVNMPLQGTAADIMKLAMVKVDTYLKENKLEEQVKMLLVVHDEILLEVENTKLAKIVKILKELMEQVVKLTVPLKVDIKVGKNWGEMKK